MTELLKLPSTEKPKLVGYYVCWLYCSDRPVILYWAQLSTQWRSGAQLMNVTHFMGPLPE